jgi:hypothetical protein
LLLPIVKWNFYVVHTLGPCLSMLGCVWRANNGSIAPFNVVLHESSCKLVPDRRGLRGRKIQLPAYGLGGRLSPAEPKPATWLGDWGRSCKLRRWALGSGLCDRDMWGVVANYAQKGFSASPFSAKLERQSAKLCRCAQSS